MKNLLSLLLAAIIAIGLSLCAAEDTSRSAVLTFLSFDGGGHEYTVEIEDPSILACEETRDYGANNPEIEDGCSYEEICEFTGLKPGTTTVTVYGRSPIMENDDTSYTAVVDEALNVTLTARRDLATFFMYRHGEIYYDSYNITRERDGYYVSVSDGEARPFAAAAAEALARVIETYDVERWDGFVGESRHVLDGEGFWLEFRLTDGTHVLARGDNAFPENYFQAVGEMQEILEGAVNGDYDEGRERGMKLTIEGTRVPVTWEENESVEALGRLAPLNIQMSMYGGFEQVGPIGQSIARDDAQTVTAPGDIVLYSGNQIVIFYGSNSWAYTRLGHVDLTARELEALLGNGDITIEIEQE